MVLSGRSLLRGAAVLTTALAIAAGCGEDAVDSGTNPDPDPDAASLANSTVSVSPSDVEVGATAALALVVRNDDGDPLAGGGETVTFTASGGTSHGTIGPVTDHLDGRFTATFTATAEGTPTTIGATIDGDAVTSTLPTLAVHMAPVDTTGPIPLIDMDGYTYYGHPGLLYPGSNDIPPDHAARQPAVDTSAPFVMLSFGYSNVKMEFCDEFDSRDVSTGGKFGPQDCADWSFVGQILSDPAQNAARNDNLVLVNGAQSGRGADEWDAPGDSTYLIVHNRLVNLGYSEADVQVVWCKQTDIRPTTSLPGGAQEADAFTLLRRLGDIVRTYKTVFPNLKQVYFSSRIYSYGALHGGGPNDEPYAYEVGFAVKWLIEAQIEQLRTGAQDALAGDLGPSVAPWLAWGPYIWANGDMPRSDGLQWLETDFKDDGTHPNPTGRGKVGTLLRDFFTTSPLTTPWFLD